jgi:hypothetical protein
MSELVPGGREVSYEIDLDDAPDMRPVLVDAGTPEVTRRPLVPPQALAVARREVALAGYRVAWHGLRSPRYVLLALLWSLVGAVRLLAAHAAWWSVLDGRRHARAAAKGDEWMKAHAQVRETARTRGIITLAVVTGVLLAADMVIRFGGSWWLLLPAVVAVPLLARAGRPADRPIITPAVVTPRFRKLNADVVLRAYYAAALGHPDKPGMQVTFGTPMARDGDGSRVDVDLPYGLGLDDAMKAKAKIASGLDVTESQVFITRDPTSHRRHSLWVADRDPLAVPVGRTPLLACKATDIWRPAPLGLDERGQLVTVPLMWNSVLVGALPRQGKTFAARLLALYCALDPYAVLDVFDGKGSPDWRKFALVADSCAFGLTPTKEGLPPEILLDTLERVKADVQDRYRRLSELEARRPDLCPEGKLTRALARDPQFGMPVRAIFIDEVQEYFDLGDISKDIAALLVFLVKVAPGAGVIVVDATQKPSGIGTGQVATQFTSFRDQHQIRLALRTSSWQVSEMVLGQGAYSEGLDSSTLLPQYKGVGLLRGASDKSPTVRTFLADGQDADRILTAARVLRERAGTLSGMAAGEQVSRQQRDVLGDVLAVFAGEPGLHWKVLAARLAERFPDRWAGATADAVSAQCRALGVLSVPVTVTGETQRGCRLQHVQEAAAR